MPTRLREGPLGGSSRRLRAPARFRSLPDVELVAAVSPHQVQVRSDRGRRRHDDPSSIWRPVHDQSTVLRKVLDEHALAGAIRPHGDERPLRRDDDPVAVGYPGYDDGRLVANPLEIATIRIDDVREG